MTATNKPIVLAILISHFVCASANAAFMEGKQMAAVLNHRETPTDQQVFVISPVVEVGPGVEFPGFGELEIFMLPAWVDIDISDRTITITGIIDQPVATADVFEFSDVFATIPKFTKAKINPATNWTGFTQATRAFVFPNTILVNVSELSGLRGQQIVIDVVPEPATAGLAAMGLLLAAWRRRLA